MALTSEEKVREIVEVDASVTTLVPFIDAASLVVTAQCEGIDADSQLIVETWLAAHFVCIRDNRVASEGAKGLSQSFQYKVDLGLDATMYGQQAKRLDPTGGLAAWDKSAKDGTTKKTASVLWVGSELE